MARSGSDERRPSPAFAQKVAARATLLISLILLICAPARSSQAAGFLIYDLSGEAVGRGSAVSAGVNEPSAVWFNPAALAFMKGTSASAGGVFVSARSRFSPNDGSPATESERGNFFLPTVFAHSAITDRVSVGMGVFTAFGIGIDWPDAWVGREAAIGASLQTVDLNPTVAVRLHPTFSLAAGFNAVRGVVDFNTGLPALVGGNVRLVGGTWGYGFNVAALYRPLPERLHVALTYRSRVSFDFSGQADFDPNPEFVRTLPDQSGTASITLPDIITLGVMGRPLPALSLGLDVNVVRWSSYDRVDIAFESAPARALQPHGRDTFTLRAGADYATRWPGLNLRAGLIFDRSAITSDNLGPGLPDANRIDGTVGAGYRFGRFKVDLGYMLVYFLDAKATTGREGPEGTYSSLAHLLGLTFAGSWAVP
jgi:long-chain fatty acid transport protein